MTSSFKSKTPWQEKLQRPQEPKIVPVPPKMVRFGKREMLIPTPKLVDDIVRRVPKGKLVTVGELRTKLARDHGGDVACPLTTGILCASLPRPRTKHRSREQSASPYWRIVRDNGELNPKFPGGVELQSRQLRDEGLAIVRNGKTPMVKDFASQLISLK